MSDKKTIEVYFDFSSPYGYFGIQKIDRLAEEYGRVGEWHPIVLGPIFKHTGGAPFVTNPAKEAYGIHDWNRMSRYMGIPYNHPDPFPIGTVAAARAFYWVSDQDADLGKTFALKLYEDYFANGKNISEKEVVLQTAKDCGIDVAALADALNDDAVKSRLNKEVDTAIEKGVVGSPYFIVDGEGFWGSDRIWMVKYWLKKGGW